MNGRTNTSLRAGRLAVAFAIPIGLAGAFFAMTPLTSADDAPARSARNVLAPLALGQVDIDASRVQGPEACSECHTYEAEAWKQTTHFKTWSVMHRSDRADEITAKMGIEGSIKRGDLCVSCHYTNMPNPESGKIEAVAGVSCESCHGASEGWISDQLHHEKAKDAATPEAREALYAKCEAEGMLRPTDIYNVARNCYSCHTVPNEELVNVGGHVAGSDFNLVGWSQGEVRHNYQYSPDQSNREATPERKRILFVVGALTELEYNMRAAAKISEKGAYLDAMKSRLPRSLKATHAILEKVDLPGIKAAAPELSNDALKALLTDPSAATAAADKLSIAIASFSAKASEVDLSAVDPLLPKPSTYTGTPRP